MMVGIPISACLVVIYTCLTTVEGSGNLYNPIPKDELYSSNRYKIAEGCRHPEDATQTENKKCMEANEITIDYTCRYSALGSYNCYCCGATFHYLEQGPVCTRYCLNQEGQLFCQPRLIRLPFNWGDEYPDKITIEENTEVSIPFESSGNCLTNPSLPDPTYGPQEEETSDYWKPKPSTSTKKTIRPTRRPVRPTRRPTRTTTIHASNERLTILQHTSDYTSDILPTDRPNQIITTIDTTTTRTRTTTTRRPSTTRRTTTIKIANNINSIRNSDGNSILVSNSDINTNIRAPSRSTRQHLTQVSPRTRRTTEIRNLPPRTTTKRSTTVKPTTVEEKQYWN